MVRTAILLGLVAALAGCSSAGYQYANGDRKILYGVDGNGHALYRHPGEPPPRASAAQMCLTTFEGDKVNHGCLDEKQSR